MGKTLGIVGQQLMFQDPPLPLLRVVAYLLCGARGPHRTEGATVNYADKLRLLADYLDARPLLRDSVEGDWQYPSLRIYADTPSQFGELVAAAGPGEKGSSGGTYGPPTLTFGVCPDDDAYEVVIELYQTADNAVCQKVEKGTKTVRRTFAIPEGAKLTETGWEVEEEVPIVEWECPESFIALREGGTVHER